MRYVFLDHLDETSIEVYQEGLCSEQEVSAIEEYLKTHGLEDHLLKESPVGPEPPLPAPPAEPVVDKLTTRLSPYISPDSIGPGGLFAVSMITEYPEDDCCIVIFNPLRFMALSPAYRDKNTGKRVIDALPLHTDISMTLPTECLIMKDQSSAGMPLLVNFANRIKLPVAMISSGFGELLPETLTEVSKAVEGGSSSLKTGHEITGVNDPRYHYFERFKRRVSAYRRVLSVLQVDNKKKKGGIKSFLEKLKIERLERFLTPQAGFSAAGAALSPITGVVMRSGKKDTDDTPFHQIDLTPPDVLKGIDNVSIKLFFSGENILLKVTFTPTPADQLLLELYLKQGKHRKQVDCLQTGSAEHPSPGSALFRLPFSGVYIISIRLDDSLLDVVSINLDDILSDDSVD